MCTVLYINGIGQCIDLSHHLYVLNNIGGGELLSLPLEHINTHYLYSRQNDLYFIHRKLLFRTLYHLSLQMHNLIEH